MFEYLLRLADNALILSQRLVTLCGHGPVLEQDIAMSNFALDLLGQAQMYYWHAAETEGRVRSEDDIVFLRDAHQYRNCLLVEQPNTDWAHTIVRQFYFDAFNFHQLHALRISTDTTLAQVAEKALKETTYHLRFSSEWVVRLGDGTALSHQKMQKAVDDLWMFTGELTTPDEIDRQMAEKDIAPNLLKLKPLWEQKVAETFAEATLTMPTNHWMQSGGKQGRHTEHLGFILAELQHIQRTYPGNKW